MSNKLHKNAQQQKPVSSYRNEVWLCKCFFSTSRKVYIWVWICTETVIKRYSLQVSFFLRKIVHGDLNEAISANETASLHGKFSLVGN